MATNENIWKMITPSITVNRQVYIFLLILLCQWHLERYEPLPHVSCHFSWQPISMSDACWSRTCLQIVCWGLGRAISSLTVLWKKKEKLNMFSPVNTSEYYKPFESLPSNATGGFRNPYLFGWSVPVRAEREMGLFPTPHQWGSGPTAVELFPSLSLLSEDPGGRRVHSESEIILEFESQHH